MNASPARVRVALFACLFSTLAAGPAPPEIIKLRVPVDRVSSFFPPGAELKGLAADAFDILVREARAGVAGRPEQNAPRLLRATHEAILRDDLLSGRTELIIQPPKVGAGTLTLDPWTPAVLLNASGQASLRSDDSGRISLRVEPAGIDPSPIKASITWQLRARPGSQGRKFTLGLPGVEACELRLDLPEGLEPEGPSGLRQGPKRVPALPGRVGWIFNGKLGVCDILLVNPDDDDDSRNETRLWVSGPTRIEVAESSAAWTLAYELSGGTLAPRLLTVSLDPGLDLLSVTGPEVEDFRSEPGPNDASRVAIRLRGRDAAKPLAPTPVVIRALARVPAEGAWIVPSAQLVNANAVWTGGSTTINLDASRIVETIKPLAGRRVLGPVEDRKIVLEAERPGPVAELLLRKPWADVSAEVQGEILVGNASPRLTTRVTWRVYRGQPRALDIDLPPSWAADRLEFDGLDESVSWHPEILPSGGMRVHVKPPSGEWTDRPLVLKLSATAAIAGGRGPLSLPRVRPVGARVSDEVWVALAESGLTLLPRRGRGLAWIDPSVVTASFSTLALKTPSAEPATTPALAWRWTSDDAEARVERDRAEQSPWGAIEEVATIEPGRLTIKAHVAISGAEPIRTLALGLSEHVVDPETWRIIDEATGAELPIRLLDPRAREVAGSLGQGPAWIVDLSHPPRASASLIVTHDAPWSGPGLVPLVLLPASLRARGTLLVLADRRVRSTLDTRNIRILDPETMAESFPPSILKAADASSLEDPSSLRRAHALAYDSPDARVELKPESMSDAPGGGLIREAVLSTSIDPRGGPGRRALTLKVVPDGAPTLTVKLPPGATLERLRRDGQPLSPMLADRVLTIPLSGSGSSRSMVKVSLDYLLDAPGSSNLTLIRPERPEFSMPCLALAWELVAPEPWGVASWGHALTPADPSLRPLNGLSLIASPWMPDWIRKRRTKSESATAMIRALDERIAADRTSDATLGEWFTRWDAGTAPLVIDRLALSRLGLGPRSRPSAPRAAASRSADAILEPLGLSAIAVGPALMITSSDVHPGTGWEAAVNQACAWGSDASDRFQSISRWRDEPTPRSSNVAASESSDSAVASGGLSVWRFAASGWPAEGLEVRLVDRGKQTAWGWTVALAVFTLGLAFRRVSPVWRATTSSVLVALGLTALASAPSSLVGAAAGLLGGALGLSVLGLAEKLPRIKDFRERRPGRSSLYRRQGSGRSGVLAPSLLALAGLGIAVPWTSAQALVPVGEGSIIALYPYEGLPDLGKPPDRVILQLQDFEALRAMAAPPVELDTPALEATEALHRVSWRDKQTVAIETELTLTSRGRGSARWTFPVDGARAIEAELDGLEIPVRIEAGAKEATVQVDVTLASRGETRQGTQTYRLKLKRLVSPRTGDWGESIVVGIKPVTNARIEVAAHPEGLRAEVPCARGLVAGVGSQGGQSGRLGPADHLDVRWSPPGGAQTLPAAGTVDALYLWDASPAGDRVRTRLTYRNPDGTSVIRIGLGSKMIVREGTIPGVVDVTREGTAERPEWVARIDPPLPDGSTISLDVWKPREAADLASNTVRTMPKLEPLGVERLTGILGFRRPPDWLGRIVPAAGSLAPFEAVSEESFVRGWGTLPEENLTLSGAVRLPPLSRFLLPSVQTGPLTSRLKAVSALELTVVSGRINLALDAELNEVGGPVHEAKLTLPRGFRPLRIAGDGLTDWSQPSPLMIRLRFDGPMLRQRKVRVEGWLPVFTDPLSPPPATRELVLPWPSWDGQEDQPGTLSVFANSKFQLVDSPGSTLIPDRTQAVSPSRAAYQSTYKVTRPDRLGRLRWEVEPPRVAVRILSKLTIEPETASWVAVLQYDVSGGPLEAINLKLPSNWARSASVWLAGVAHQQIAETRGDTTYWSIRPDRSLWGSQRLVVRASAPFGAGETRGFPDINPLGYGAVDSFMTVVNATRRKLDITPSAGLQTIAAGAVPPDDELSAASTGAAVPTAYRVVKPGWSLRLEKPVEVNKVSGDTDQSALRHAELSCVLGADGSLWGSGRYQLSPRSGPFLGVEMPNGGVPFWVSVNGAPARLSKASAGRWEIPLMDELGGRVELVWRVEKAPAETVLHEVGLPIVGEGKVPAVVTIRAPGGLEVSGSPGRLVPISEERIDLEKAAWLGEQTIASLPTVDRRSRRDGEALVAALVRIELWLRQAVRAAAFNPDAGTAPRETQANLVRLAADRLRSRLEETLKNASLEGFETAALAYLGLAPNGAENTIPPSADAGPLVTMRALGSPRQFQGELGGPDRKPALVWSRRPGPETAERSWRFAIFGLSAILPGCTWLMARRQRPLRGAGLGALGFSLAAALVWAGPGWLAVGLAAAALGAFTRN